MDCCTCVRLMSCNDMPMSGSTNANACTAVECPSLTRSTIQKENSNEGEFDWLRWARPGLS